MEQRTLGVALAVAGLTATGATQAVPVVSDGTWKSTTYSGPSDLPTDWNVAAMVWSVRCMASLVVMLGLGCQAALAVPLDFIKVAGIDTPVLGGDGTFRGFQDSASDGSSVVFHANLPDRRLGIYLGGSGTVRSVFDSSVPMPGASGVVRPSDGARTPVDVSDGNVAFQGWDESDRLGIYAEIDGRLRVVADASTPLPGGNGNFTEALHASIDARAIAFETADTGVYLYEDEEIRVVADQSTLIPGSTDSFVTRCCSLPRVDAGNVAFFGVGPDGQGGIYVDRDGALSTVVDTSTAIPGGVGMFTDLQLVGFDDDTVAFFGAGSDGQTGFYLDLGGSLKTLVDASTPVPDGSGNFTGIGRDNGSFASGDLVFSFGRIVYSDLGTGGVPRRVIGPGDLLDGYPLETAFVLPYSAGRGAFSLTTESTLPPGPGARTNGIYLVRAVPEPITLGLLVMGVAGLATSRSWPNGRHHKSNTIDASRW